MERQKVRMGKRALEKTEKRIRLCSRALEEGSFWSLLGGRTLEKGEIKILVRSEMSDVKRTHRE